MPFKLNDLKTYSEKNKKRVGRGSGSGTGKTSGRGHKGQKSRSGSPYPHRAFEGGQTPLSRRSPKIGFTAPIKNVKEVQLSVLRDLESIHSTNEYENCWKKFDKVKVLKNCDYEPKYKYSSKISFSTSIKRK